MTAHNAPKGILRKPMRMQLKTNTENRSNSILTTACIAIAFVAVMFGMGQHEDAQMARYAQANNCTWHATGSFYGDQRDYVCK